MTARVFVAAAGAVENVRLLLLSSSRQFPKGLANGSGLLGHPYRMRINFDNGRYAFCKVRGRPGELAVKAPRPVLLPPVCGG